MRKSHLFKIGASLRALPYLLYLVSFSLFAKSEIIYGVVPSLFGERPFKDLTARMADLKDLGVDVLWVAPVNQTDDLGAISYSVTDHYEMRTDLGTRKHMRME